MNDISKLLIQPGSRIDHSKIDPGDTFGKKRDVLTRFMLNNS